MKKFAILTLVVVFFTGCNSGGSSISSTGTLSAGSVGGYLPAGMCQFTIAGNPPLSVSPVVTGSAGGATFTCSAFECTNRTAMNGTTGGVLTITASSGVTTYNTIEVIVNASDCKPMRY